MKRLILLLVLLLVCQSGYCQVPADLVLTNATVITVQQVGHRAEAVAIRGNKIVWVGKTADAKPYIGPKTQVADLRGKTVIPGLNDAHLHPTPQYPFEAPYATLQLDTVSSMKSLLTILRRKAAVTPAGMPITGYGYNEFRIGGQPLRDTLDQVSTRHPILISNISGHYSAGNWLVFSLANITEATPDPAGGAFDRYVGTQRPNGLIRESARRMLKMPALPRPGPAEEYASYKRYFQDLLAEGITSIGDAGISPARLKIYEQLVAEGFPMRFNLMISESSLGGLIDGSIPRVSTERLRVGSVKVFHGNSLSGNTCWLSEPYEKINPATGKQDYYGIPPARSQAALDSLFARIHNVGLQICVHSNGDREIEMVLTAIERAQQANPRINTRHRIEHCSVTTPELLARIKRDSVMVVLHTYIYELGQKMMVYGAKRLAMMHPTRSAMEAGIPVALHSDSPVSSYRTMIRLASTVNRKTAQGLTLGEGQRISVDDALRLWAVGGAYATFDETRKGRIAPGQLADLVVLDKDPSAVPADDIKNINILTTLLDGKVVYGNL